MAEAGDVTHLGLTEMAGQGSPEAGLPSGNQAGGTLTQQDLLPGPLEVRKIVTAAGPNQTGLADQEFLRDLGERTAVEGPGGPLSLQVQALIQALPGRKAPEVS